MKNIGIVTIIDNDNYGNRLQNFALQTVLNRLNTETTTILNNPHKKKKISDVLLNFHKIRKKHLVILFNRLLNCFVRRKRFESYITKRQLNFKIFNEKIKFSDFVINQEHNDFHLLDSYDSFIVGSDQIWNYQHRNFFNLDFLKFAPKFKRNSYAASLGVDFLPPNILLEFEKELLNFNSISFRENQGRNLFSREIINSSHVHLDPTMLISKEDWDCMTETNRLKNPENFITTYMLGGISNELEKFILKICSEKNYDFVELMNINKPDYYEYGPSEFVQTIKKSKLVITDSFHAAVFSILFNVPFIIVKRGNMNSRLENLLKIFGMLDRKFEDVNEKNIFECNYKDLDEILNIERNKALTYLSNIVKGVS